MHIEDMYEEYKLAMQNVQTLRSALEEHSDIGELTDGDQISDPPSNIVSDYTEYIIRYGQVDVPDDYITNEIVRKAMVEFVRNCSVFSMDYKAVYDNGWSNHALRDSNPRGSIREIIQEYYEDKR